MTMEGYYYGFKYKNIYFMINESYYKHKKHFLNKKALDYELNKFTEKYSLNETKLKLDDILKLYNEIKPNCQYKYDLGKIRNIDDNFEKIFNHCYLFLMNDINDLLYKYNGINQKKLNIEHDGWSVEKYCAIFLIDLDNINFIFNYLNEELDKKPEDLVIPIANWNKKRKHDDI